MKALINAMRLVGAIGFAGMACVFESFAACCEALSELCAPE